MGIEVRQIASEQDLRTAARTDLTSFGHPFDETRFARGLDLRRAATSYLAHEDDTPVGACLVHDFEMTVPGTATVALAGVADVGVLPSHRRRGVLSAMVDRMLADAARSGKVAAGLHASEATIYGRFGFGAATRHRKVSIPTARARLRTDVDVAPGRLEVAHPEGRPDSLRPIHEQAMGRRPGEVRRLPQRWATRLAGDDGDEPKMLCLLHRDPDGTPDAYVLYRVVEDWAPAGPDHTLELQELVALHDPAELAMWQALLSMDLVATVVAWLPADSLLFDALEDSWAPHTIGEHDGLWLRLLDVPTALESRRYRVAGSLVVDVADPRAPDGSRTAGTWRLDVRDDGSAGLSEVPTAPSGEGPRVDLRLGVAELASVWLGGGSFARLHSVGRCEEATPGAARRADAIFGWWPTPWITEFF